MLLRDLTRDRISSIAPESTVVLPTASIEQHGPHLPVEVDTLLCGRVAKLSVAAAETQATAGAICLAPVHSWGNSHHHRPYAGVLSLSSPQYMACVSEILEGLYLSGFRRLFLLNGHGGNTAPNSVVAQDFVNRHGHAAHVASADYWNIGKQALVAAGLIRDERIPGHAGEFETALIKAIKPEAVSESGLSEAKRRQDWGESPYPSTGISVQSHGAFQAQGGYTDEPWMATSDQGRLMLDIIVSEVVKEILALHTLPSVKGAGSG